MVIKFFYKFTMYKSGSLTGDNYNGTFNILTGKDLRYKTSKQFIFNCLSMGKLTNNKQELLDMK